MSRKRIILLGCTGSIGSNTLDVVAAHDDRFHIVAASAHTNETGLLEAAARHNVPYLALSGVAPADNRIQYCGRESLLRMIQEVDADVVVNAIAGSPGLLPSVAALESGKDLALANKESLVMAGKMIMALASSHDSMILPIDSEHAALFSLCSRMNPDEINELILTASGGAFRDLPIEALSPVNWKDALAHPTWDMGTKITIDSASMANKGLEIIEACELFGVPEHRVKVVVHPQSCVHGMVSSRSGSVYAQLSLPDMRTPIHDALTYPSVVDFPFERLNFGDLHLDFSKPDNGRYPCLELARNAARAGGAYPLVYNAANELAVEAFISERILFTDIPTVIESCLEGDWGNLLVSVNQVMETDLSAREKALSILSTMA